MADKIQPFNQPVKVKVVVWKGIQTALKGDELVCYTKIHFNNKKNYKKKNSKKKKLVSSYISWKQCNRACGRSLTEISTHTHTNTFTHAHILPLNHPYPLATCFFHSENIAETFLCIFYFEHCSIRRDPVQKTKRPKYSLCKAVLSPELRRTPSPGWSCGWWP